MTQYLLLNETELKQKNAYWTAREISQQPESWCNTAAIIETHRAEINAFLAPILALKELQIVLKHMNPSTLSEAIATADKVARGYFSDLDVKSLWTLNS